MLQLEVYDLNVKHIAGGEEKNLEKSNLWNLQKKEWKNKRCNSNKKKH